MDKDYLTETAELYFGAIKISKKAIVLHKKLFNSAGEATKKDSSAATMQDTNF